MRMICIGSSSKGNGYILKGKNQVLLLEAGLPLANVRKHVTEFSKIQGCLISHRHGDHAKYMGDFMKAGIKCYANDDVWEHYGSLIKHGETLVAMEQITLGEFTVVPMFAHHDVPCFAYLIKHDEMGKLLFITDSAGFGCTFPSLDHIMIECNWSEECMQLALEEGRTNSYVAKRSKDTHFGLEKMLEYLQSEQIANNAKEVVLLHLSHENSNPQQFSQIVSKSLNKPIYIAQNGLQIDFIK